MRSKLTLSIEKKTIKQAKSLAKKRKSTVSQLFSDFIEQNSRIEKKMKAFENVKGAVDSSGKKEEQSLPGYMHDKHGW